MRLAKILTLTVAMAAAGNACAQFVHQLTVAQDGGAGLYGASLYGLQGQVDLTFSPDLLSFFEVVGSQTTFLAPTHLDYTGQTIQAKVASLSFTHTSTVPYWTPAAPPFTIDSLGMQGGITWTIPTANFASTGGALSLSNLEINLATQGVYADISGANGLTARKARIWDYASFEGDAAFPFTPGIITIQNTVSGLTLTDEAIDMFAQGLGLKVGGLAALRLSGDASMTTLTTLEVHMLPEPSTYLMMGLGLGGLFLAARRRKSGGTPA